MNCPNSNTFNTGQDTVFPRNYGVALTAMACPCCNATDHRPGAKFCRCCGTQLTVLACPVCKVAGHRLGAKFCRHCGSSLETTASDEKDGKTVENQRPVSLHPDACIPKSVMAVDLGLPSGTKWASCNIGASTPEEYGDYYSWGETVVKDKYGWKNYKYFDCFEETDDDAIINFAHSICQDIGEDICGTEYDAAHLKWGKEWQMPTLAQIKELINSCDFEWTSVKGVDGGKFTGPNGNSIFLPAAGYMEGSDLEYEGESGFYWSGTLDSDDSEDAILFTFEKDGPDHYGCNRKDGQMIRPVTTR